MKIKKLGALLVSAAALADSDSIDQAKFFVTSWGDLRDTLTNSTEAVINAQLTQGITWEEGSIVIPAGKTVTLNLPDGLTLMQKIAALLFRCAVT